MYGEPGMYGKSYDSHMLNKLWLLYVQAGRDFYESVRAVLVDRDNSLQWTPAILQDVADEFAGQYFARLPASMQMTKNCNSSIIFDDCE